jgi:hypothetical protein
MKTPKNLYLCQKDETYEISKKNEELQLFFIGKMVEDVENQIRRQAENVSFPKTKDVLL